MAQKPTNLNPEKALLLGFDKLVRKSKYRI